jgi:SpoVK/Ycf46/Vps4 family AAA+-type ATPase
LTDIFDEYVHLVRLALEGQQKDVLALAKKSIRQLTKSRPDLVDPLRNIISEYNNSMVIRDNSNQPMPIDIDSKLELLRKEFIVLDNNPIWPKKVFNELNAVIEERKHESELQNIGLSPTRSIIFIGPPGVGKTLAAKWLSFQLKRPLYTLDLAAVMSSFLGRTGNNIRAVLNYAQKTPSILLLDEFDAVAKRRNDDSEIGELKRLVTVLLQAVDEWPSKGLLIAATNHPELLDPAVWRRFERIVEFPNPTKDEIQYTINELLPIEKSLEIMNNIEIIAILLEGVSFAEVVRQINLTRRESVIKEIDLVVGLNNLVEKLCNNFVSKDLDRNKKLDLALKLQSTGISQRKVSEMTGVSRDTIRKHQSVQDNEKEQ